MALKRELGLIELTLMGVGMILGAGIYVLVGIAGVQAGPSLWLAFVVAGIISLLTGLSYAELASAFPKAGSSFNYVKHAFKNNSLAFVSGWVFIASAVVAAATVSLGFAQYVNSLGIAMQLLYSAVIILAIAVFLNIKGVNIASKVNDFATLLEVLGLVIVIVIGFGLTQPSISIQMPNGLEGFFSAVALAFFAFIGFEVIANEAGEAKNPSKNVPLALILAIVISLVLYSLTAISFTSMASYEQIIGFAQTKVGPLASAVGIVAGGGMLLVLSVIALFSTGNTVLLSITAASRMVYGMSEGRALPKQFSQTIKSTPVKAILLSGLIALVLLFAGNIEVVANASVLGMLLVFALDNFSVIKLRFAEPKTRRPFKLPLNIGGVPVTAALGAFSCIGLFAYSAITSTDALLILIALIALGIILNKIEARK